MLNEQYSELLFQTAQGHANEKQLFVPTSMTGAKLSLDGDQYCCLLGENLQVGIAGFGDTPYAAMCKFNDVFYSGELK